MKPPRRHRSPPRSPSDAPLLIRRAGLRDVEYLVHLRIALYEELFRSEGRQQEIPAVLADAKRYRRWLRKMLKGRRLLAWVLETQAHTLVGGGLLWLEETAMRPGIPRPVLPTIHSMYTEPAYRGHGAAARVVHEMLRWAEEHGYSRVVLRASAKAVPLYTRIGFRPIREMMIDLPPKPNRRARRSRR